MLVGQAGFGVAVQYALDLGMDAIWQRIQLLANLARHLLAQVPGVRLFDSGGTLCGIIAFTKVVAPLCCPCLQI